MIFIDTGAFVARYVERDQHHAAAIAFWDELARYGMPCLTSNFVLSETFTLLGRRTTHLFAAQRARQVYSSSVLQILRPEASDEATAVILFEQYAGQQVSYCDCISFALMRRHGIMDCFAFDEHFAIAGFKIRP
jgi:predicted nucleic acid-binding protein